MKKLAKDVCVEKFVRNVGLQQELDSKVQLIYARGLVCTLFAKTLQLESGSLVQLMCTGSRLHDIANDFAAEVGSTVQLTYILGFVVPLFSTTSQYELGSAVQLTFTCARFVLLCRTLEEVDSVQHRQRHVSDSSVKRYKQGSLAAEFGQMRVETRKHGARQERMLQHFAQPSSAPRLPLIQ